VSAKFATLRYRIEDEIAERYARYQICKIRLLHS
jgi:hypothetical protein